MSRSFIRELSILSEVTTRRLRRHIAVMVAVVMLGSSVVSAQGTRGTISGMVTDANGAVIQQATVRLVDVAKGVEVRTVKSDNEGRYRFLEVEPAVYDVIVAAQGFSEKTLNNVKVEPNRNLNLDVPLGAAGVSEEIIVTAGQELVDREKATLGTTVERQRVQGLPLNGREVLQLATLQPGVTSSNLNTEDSFGAGLGIRVNGQRGVENNITLDGANNNEVAIGGSVGTMPRPDAVEEFRLLTSNFEAEFGRNTGSVVNVVTKSGGSIYHGNVRLFYRPTFLSAARFFDQNSPNDNPRRGNGDFRRPFERKEFGGNFGGPVYIPRLYHGKERTFFFVDYERRAQLIGASRTSTGLPSVAERNGDFSGLGRPIIDPQSGAPFPGNRIPASRFSPIAQYYLGFIPGAGVTGEASSGADETLNTNYLTSRVDHQISTRQVLNFSFNFSNSLTNTAFPFGGSVPNDSSVPGFGGIDRRHGYNYVGRHTYSFTSTLLNSFLASYSRNNFPALQPQNRTTPREIGFTADFAVEPSLAGPPMIFFFDRNFSVGNAIQGPQARVSENFQIQDSVSWGTGNHRFKFGFDGTKHKQDQAFLFINQGLFLYSGLFGPNSTGDDFADFLIGNSPAAIQFGANGDRDFRQDAVAAFAQDTWRARDNLTISYGLRYEYTSPLTDKFNRVSYYREGAVSQLLTSGQLRSFEGIPIVVPPGGSAPTGIVFVGDPDPVLGGTVPAGGVRKDLNNWAPRVGLAYSPGIDKGWLRHLFGGQDAVIRAGFGVFYGATIGDTILQQLSAPGFSGTNAFFFPASGTLADPFAPDPFPLYQGNLGQIPNPFTQSQFLLSAPLQLTSQPTDPNIRTPYSIQWNLTLERGFLKNYVGSVSYVGNVGRKLYAQEQLNPALGTFFPAPPGTPRPDQTNQNSRRLNPDLQAGIGELVSAANSWYNALQANLQRRFSNGLLFQAAYTWSKSINETDTQRGNLDRLNRSANRALSSDDVPHRMVVSWLYDLPFAKSLSGVAGTFFGGWGIGGIATFQSGTPFSVANPFDTTGDGGAVISFADLGSGFQHIDPKKNDGRAFNPDAFVQFGNPATFDVATQFRRGTAGRNQFRLRNGVNNLDLVLTKKTRLWSETSNLELRFEAFNALNHTQFTRADLNLNPNTIVRDPGTGAIDPLRSSFGKFVDARESRVIQLGARISF